MTERKVAILGTTPARKPFSPPDAGRWRLGKAEGAFAKAEAQTFAGVPVVVTNDKREVLTLRFDRKTGLVWDESETYRPDAALLRAMWAEGPPRPFGKK